MDSRVWEGQGLLRGRGADAGTAGDRCTPPGTPTPPATRKILAGSASWLSLPQGTVRNSGDKDTSLVPVPTHSGGLGLVKSPARSQEETGASPTPSLHHRCPPSQGLLQCPHQLQGWPSLGMYMGQLS